MRARATTHGVLWDKYRQAMGDTVLPRPFDELALIARLAARRGRPIELIPVDALPNLPCGLLMVTDQADCIVYATDTSTLHQRHILLHEAAHLVCGHDRVEPVPGAGGRDVPPGSRALLPHLPDALVRRVLGRTVYSEPQEHEAELLASLICSRVAREADTPQLAEGQQRRLGSMFGAPPARGGARG
ncbi:MULTISPECIES: ParH-like protein [unclassified Streptomyces]|uniref:ParH-like protein n=1 Tax=unclassified Streptomyces TaxID=2593676 RepID=UPI002E34F2AD|nr:ParH-like protein [Streptomyces sp. NBC_00669]